MNTVINCGTLQDIPKFSVSSRPTPSPVSRACSNAPVRPPTGYGMTLLYPADFEIVRILNISPDLKEVREWTMEDT